MTITDEQFDSLMRDFVEPQMPSAEIRAKRNKRIYEAIFNPKTDDVSVVQIQDETKPSTQPYLDLDLDREK